MHAGAQHNINDAAKFNGAGDSAQSNRLSGYITATVIRVLVQRNLLIKGESGLAINQGRVRRLSGVIARSTRADNSIHPTRLAARILLRGKGALADANAQGWLPIFNFTLDAV